MMECVGRLVAMAFVRTKVVKNLPKRKKICYNIAPTEQMRSTFFILAVKNFPVKLLRGYPPHGLCDAHNKRTHELLTLGKIQASLFCPHLLAIVYTLYIGCEKFPMRERFSVTSSGIL